jgi:hypothetical protein
MRDLRLLTERLCRASHTASVRPAPRLEWPARLEGGQWFVSPELISLYDTPVYDALPEAARRRLSFWEAVNFFSLNLHGERFLVRGLAQRAAAPNWRELAPYLEHFHDEEERHTGLFGEFCRRYAGKIYRDRTLVVARQYETGEDDVLFFARALIFEEIVDTYNRRMASDDRLAPVARQINRLHHLDETRHLAFGRALLSALLARHAPAWRAETLARVRAALAGYVTTTWKSYYNADVYRDAGLADAYRLREGAFCHPHTRARRDALTRRCLRGLYDQQLLCPNEG